jgi:hypothetical protein
MKRNEKQCKTIKNNESIYQIQYRIMVGFCLNTQIPQLNISINHRQIISFIESYIWKNET